MLKLILGMVLAVFATQANAQTSFTAKDASAVTQTFKSFSCSGNICALNVPADNTGAAFGVTGNPFYTVHPSADPCNSIAATYTPISVTSATTTRIVAPTSAKRTYVCYMFLLSAIANNIGIVEGTGGTCGSGTAGVVGGTAAANGINLAANGGAVFQAGGNAAIATAGTNVDLCLITSAAGPVAGHIKWVQAP